MDCQLICKWLGLPPDGWPPDHYALLGLERGEGDIQKIEEHVHQRLIRIRQYQLNHPDQATEAMNRLAQAFSCLTDPRAKKAYDESLRAPVPPRKVSPYPPTRTPPPPSRPSEPVRPAAPATSPAIPVLPAAPPTTPAAPAAPPAAPAEPPADPLAWLFGPWNAAEASPAPPMPLPPAEASPPVVGDWKKEPPPQRATAAPAAGEATPSPAAPESPAPAAVPIAMPAPLPAPTRPAAQSGPHERHARRGLGTKRKMYARIAVTRQLIDAWRKAGNYLGKPERRLTRIAEANDLIRQLNEIQELLEEFPPLLGEAGQPGYLVIALARQPQVVPTLRALLPSQREALARDWNAGYTLLTEHRTFLRQELRVLRRKSLGGRAARALRSFLNDHPGRILVAVAVIALLLGLWTYYRYR